MEKLEKYLDDRRKKGVTNKEVAKAFGCSAPYLSELKSGKKTPRLPLAVQIARVTKGAVKESDWVKGPEVAE